MHVYWLWLALLRGLSLRQKHQLLEAYHEPERLYAMDPASLEGFGPEVAEALGQKDLAAAEALARLCRQEKVGITPYGGEDYPPRLRNIEDPPVVLYYKGTLPQWQAQPVIGVVGTRDASTYGLHAARMVSAQIAACGGLVVSGAASGIDTAAMEAALEVGKPTVGVLGCGVDTIYPAKNKDLFLKTQASGCILSEYQPGTRPYAGNFLRRNRIISGISDGVLVVEAPERSGALNTAAHAASQGRDLFAVPGNLGVDSCLGSNQLLQEGAYPALSGWDVVKHYASLYPGAVENRPVTLQPKAADQPSKVAQNPDIPGKTPPKKEKTGKKIIDNLEKSTYSVLNEQQVQLSDAEAAVFSLLTPVPQLPDAVMDRSEMPAGAVQSILTRLALRGLVQTYPDGRVSRK